MIFMTQNANLYSLISFEHLLSEKNIIYWIFIKIQTFLCRWMDVVVSYIIINFEPLKSMRQNFWLHWHKFPEYKSKYFHTLCVSFFSHTKKFLCWSPKILLISINILPILYKIFLKLFYAFAFNQNQSRHLRAEIVCFSQNRSIFFRFGNQLHCLKKSHPPIACNGNEICKAKNFLFFFMYRRWAKKFPIIDLPARDKFSAAKCLSIKIISVHHIDYAIINCSVYVIGSKNWW